MKPSDKTELQQEELELEEKEDGSVSISLPGTDDEVKDASPDPEKKDQDEEDDDQDEDEPDEPEEEVKQLSSDAALEAKREKRRLEKKARYERQKRERESDKLKIQALERQLNEVLPQLAKVNDIESSFKLSQVDKKIDDLNTQIEYAKLKLTDAINEQNGTKQAELLEILTDLKSDLKQAKFMKDEELKSIKNNEDKGHIQTPEKARLVDLQNNYARQWMKKHPWFDSQLRDFDSKLVKLLDKELGEEGIYQPYMPEYWDELTLRCEEKLAHRFTARKTRMSTTTSSRSDDSPPAVVKSKREFYLSPARKQAMIDAGAWDDPVKRQRMIRSYIEYDNNNQRA